MASAKSPIYIDEGLLGRAQAIAAQRGIAVEDIVEEILQRALDVDTCMEMVWAKRPDDLTDEESLEFATREVHAMP